MNIGEFGVQSSKEYQGKSNPAIHDVKFPGWQWIYVHRWIEDVEFEKSH